MKNTCSQYLFLFLLSLSTSPPPPVEASIERLRWIYHFQDKLISRKDARDHCKSGGKGHLAIARNALDVKYFSDICKSSYGHHDNWDSYGRCWVGLHRRPGGGWIWYGGQNNSLPVGTLPSSLSFNCAMVSNDQLIEYYCPRQLYFLCEYNTLLLVEEEKTWEEALHHCRALEPDTSNLLSFHNEEELSYAQDEMARAQTEEVWIGLRWLAGRWLWMDQTAGGTISLAECPANGTHCGSLSGGGQHARNCMEKRRFFCLKWALV